MGFDKLSEEERSRLSSCETPEAFLKMAAEYGVVLSEEELTMINGGVESFRDSRDHLAIYLLKADDKTDINAFADKHVGCII